MLAWMAALLLLWLTGFVPGATGAGDSSREKLVQTATELLGVSYRHGGSMESGFDCSGFVRYVYGRHGVTLPRTARAQYDRGRHVELADARPGDLVFFRIDGVSISHVGIYLGEKRFIHAPSTGKQVSIARMDETYWEIRFAGVASFLW